MMPSFVARMVIDYEKFDNNSIMLHTLNDTFKSITVSNSDELLRSLYIENKLLEKFNARFSLSEFTLKPNQRKDIYAYMHKFVLELVSLES